MAKINSIKKSGKVQRTDKMSNKQVLSESDGSTIWNSAIHIDSTLEEYVHRNGGCTFEEFQRKITDIQGRANEKNSYSK